MKLEGRVALVTGGANGIGRASSLLLAAEGATVFVADLDDPRMRQLEEEVAAAGAGRAVAVRCDLADEASIRQTIETAVAQTGRLDILVNCAGGSGMSPFYKSEAGKAQYWSEDVPLSEWQASIELNLTAVFIGCKYAIPQMKQQGGGAIVNFSSIGSDVGRADGTFAYVAYAAAKAGVCGLTRQLARELGQFGIRVNCVSPGSTLSERMRARYDSDPVWAETSQRQVKTITALQRLGEPAELAQAVLFLASDDSSYITGVTLDVNGGRYMR